MTSLMKPLAAKIITREIRQIKKTKRLCHLKNFRIKPEIMGPQASAEPMTNPASPIVLPRLAGGVIVRRTVW